MGVAHIGVASVAFEGTPPHSAILLEPGKGPVEEAEETHMQRLETPAVDHTHGLLVFVVDTRGQQQQQQMRVGAGIID